MEETMKAAMAFLNGEINAEEGVDRLCIVHEHSNDNFAWRFDAKKMDPFAIIQYVLFYTMLENTGYKKRIEELETKVKALEEAFKNAV